MELSPDYRTGLKKRLNVADLLLVSAMKVNEVVIGAIEDSNISDFRFQIARPSGLHEDFQLPEGLAI